MPWQPLPGQRLAGRDAGHDDALGSRRGHGFEGASPELLEELLLALLHAGHGPPGPAAPLGATSPARPGPGSPARRCPGGRSCAGPAAPASRFVPAGRGEGPGPAAVPSPAPPPAAAAAGATPARGGQLRSGPSGSSGAGSAPPGLDPLLHGLPGGSPRSGGLGGLPGARLPPYRRVYPPHSQPHPPWWLCSPQDPPCSIPIVTFPSRGTASSSLLDRGHPHALCGAQTRRGRASAWAPTNPCPPTRATGSLCVCPLPTVYQTRVAKEGEPRATRSGAKGESSRRARSPDCNWSISGAVWGGDFGRNPLLSPLPI